MAHQVEIKNSTVRPPVDIIIPYHGQYDSLLKTYSAIQNYTPNQPYFVYLVDDGSQNKTFLTDFLSGRKRTFGIQIEEQSGFGEAINRGVAAGTSPYVVIMHSDCCPQNIYWLMNLQRIMLAHKDKGVKLVSSRVTNPGTASDYPSNWVYNGDDENDENDDLILADKPIPLTCVLFHRELFNRTGGLRPYPYAWYEDVEFSYRMNKLGFKQAIAKKSIVWHEGGRTINHLAANNPNAYAKMANNAKLCKEHTLTKK